MSASRKRRGGPARRRVEQPASDDDSCGRGELRERQVIDRVGRGAESGDTHAPRVNHQLQIRSETALCREERRGDAPTQENEQEDADEGRPE